MFFLPHSLPAAAELHTGTYSLRDWQQAGCGRRVLLLNLMPHKPVTELDVARTLCATGIPFQLLLMKIKGQTYKTTPVEHMEAFYLDFEELEPHGFERLIITGAPVEQYAFEEVRYWDALCRIMDWAGNHVERTLYVCWGAQAALYHRYGIPKYGLSQKRFGVFSQQVLVPDSPLMKGLSPAFPMPNSRHTEVRRADIEALASPGLHLLAESGESGVGVLATPDCRHTYIVGHLEYEPFTLHNEYRRDLAKGLPIHAPEHYYAPDGSVPFVWEQAAKRFYANWLGD